MTLNKVLNYYIIFKEDPPPRFNVPENLFPGRRQGFLDDQLLKKLVMEQCVIRDRGLLIFIILCCHCVTHPFPGSRRENGFLIILR